MTRSELTDLIRARKRAKHLTWRDIAAVVPDLSPVFVTAALLGQMRLLPEQADAVGELLGLDAEERAGLAEIPYRGSLTQGPPTDPLVYRFYELVQVYGTTWKAMIEEDFGDGIMSAIDFDMQMERVPDPKGDRVKLTMTGKFLPYRRY